MKLYVTFKVQITIILFEETKIHYQNNSKRRTLR